MADRARARRRAGKPSRRATEPRSAIRVLLGGVLLAGLTALPTGTAGASSASMDAQQIPVGLIPDVSSLARFPASGLSIPAGLYGDVEPSAGGQHAALFALGHSRIGLLYSPLDPACVGCENQSAVGAFVSLPAGALRLGAAVRGADSRREHLSSRDSSFVRDRTWWATLGAGVALSAHSYLELALSGGQIEQAEYSRRDHAILQDSMVTLITSECADPGSSYGAELRWKGGVGAELTGFAILSYRHEDLSVERLDFSDGYNGAVYDIAQSHPRERERVAAALAVRGKGPGGARVTAGLSGEYLDDDWFRIANPYANPPETLRERYFETRLTAFVGLSATLRSWCDLFAGLTGNYRSEHTVQYHDDPSQSGLQDDSVTWSQIRGGFRLHTKAFYLDALVANSVSSSNPFTGLSVGYRF